MKIICTTKREVNTTESCGREYCCKKMKWAMKMVDRHTCDNRYPHLTIQQDKIQMVTHSHYDGGSEFAFINYCPWCDTKIVIEHEKIDNTGLPPVDPVPCVPKKKTKNRWWTSIW